MLSAFSLLALAGLTAAAPPSQWATVRPDGSVETFKPTTTAVNGAETVLNAFPAQLTQSVTYVQVNEEGAVATETGRVPMPSAAADGSAAFLVCANRWGMTAPYCSPSPGESVVVKADETYYFTWDGRFFEENMTIAVSGRAGGNSGTEVFRGETIDPRQGYYAWNAPSALLNGSAAQEITIQFAFESGARGRMPAGSVWLTSNVESFSLPEGVAQAASAGSSGNDGKVVAVGAGVGASLGAVILALVGVIVWMSLKQKKMAAAAGYDSEAGSIQREKMQQKK